MKPLFGTLFVVLLAIILLINIAKPNVPAVSGIPNYNVGIGCLGEVSRKYNPDYFTYKGWIMSWYARQASKWGIKMSPSLLNFYKKYIDLQFDVNCYVSLSNDPDFNMTLSPTEFEAIYNVIAENHGFQKIE